MVRVVGDQSHNMIEQVGITNNKADQVAPNDTIYLCNFRVSVDGEWLCLKVKLFLNFFLFCFFVESQTSHIV